MDAYFRPSVFPAIAACGSAVFVRSSRRFDVPRAQFGERIDKAWITARTSSSRHRCRGKQLCLTAPGCAKWPDRLSRRRSYAERVMPRQKAHHFVRGVSWWVPRKRPERPMPAQRAYGMDQDFYRWSPIDRARLPGDERPHPRAALSATNSDPARRRRQHFFHLRAALRGSLTLNFCITDLNPCVLASHTQIFRVRSRCRSPA
jgi:hypothetical protein